MLCLSCCFWLWFAGCPSWTESLRQALSAPDGVIVSRRRREICQSEVCEKHAREAKILSRLAVKLFVGALTMRFLGMVEAVDQNKFI